MANDPASGAASALNSLNDDDVKLIAYTIVSLKRDEERILDGGKDSLIVTDRMTEEAFISWILARYLQQQVPDLRNSAKQISRSKLYADELKYLRVYYVVSHRWPREPKKFEEREIDVLEGIRNNLNLNPGSAHANR